MIDYMIWPWLERLEALKVMRDLDLNEKRLPKLTAYLKRMLVQPAVQKLLIPSEVHVKFYEGYLNGQGPDYDLGLLGQE